MTKMDGVRLWTDDNYQNSIEKRPPEESRVKLIHEQLVNMEPKSPRNARKVKFAYDTLFEALKNRTVVL